MKRESAVALVALALIFVASVPAQHGAGRGGFASQNSFSRGSNIAHPGFAGSRGFPPSHGNGSARRFLPPSMPGRMPVSSPSRLRLPSDRRNPHAIGPSRRPPYEGSRPRDPRRHRHWYGSSFAYANPYPVWLSPYPFVIDPGFYDWNTYDGGEAPGGSEYAPQGAGSESGAPWNDSDDLPAWPAADSSRRITNTESTTPASRSGDFLTVIFIDGREPVQVQNYMLNKDFLTDLDRQHYEQIPLNQIDIAATRLANRSRGVDFSVPMTTQN